LIAPILIDSDNFFNDDVIMSSLLKKLPTSIRIYVVKPSWSLFGQFPKLSTESVGSRRGLIANCVHTADATKQFRRVGVGGVYWALRYCVPYCVQYCTETHDVTVRKRIIPAVVFFSDVSDRKRNCQLRETAAVICKL